MTTNDGFIPRSQVLQNLKALFDLRATLAPGMASPRGLDYGIFILDDVPALMSLKAMFLDWTADADSPVTRVPDGLDKYREATDDELRVILAHFTEKVARCVQGHRELKPVPEWALHNNLCAEILEHQTFH